MVNIKTEPYLYLVAETGINDLGISRFENDYGLDYENENGFHSKDYACDAEAVIEGAGRICYMSFKPDSNKLRRNNKEYIQNIIRLGHGSVLEHSSATIIFTGVSRTFSHELVRHRAGFSYSQLSQRYVSLEDTCFVKPPAIPDSENDPSYQTWLRQCELALEAYTNLIESLKLTYPNKNRKQILEAARSVLPNCTETIITVTANLRAWRHFLELRCTPFADLEMNITAYEVYKILKENIPVVFNDYSYRYEEGYHILETQYKKV